MTHWQKIILSNLLVQDRDVVKIEVHRSNPQKCLFTYTDRFIEPVADIFEQIKTALK